MISGSENVIFRNLVFDELWEWDDLVYYKANADGSPKYDSKGNLQLSEGDYDRNDWDYICVDSESDGVWIDHCTFYKAYDGVIDIKNPKTGVKDNEAERVTVSWCKFEEKSAPDANGNHPFYDEQLEWLKTHVNETNYYRALMAEEKTDVSVTAIDGEIFTQEQSATIKGEGFSDALIESYTRGQKKTHLLGQGDSATNAVGIRATFANNIYHNSMDRMPRLRRGNAHMYNSVLDASDIYYAHRLEGGDTTEAKAERAKLDGHLVSNGAISTVDGNVFLDTCYIDGIEGAILSGNGSSDPGYIGWENCKYKLGNDISELTITYKNNTDNKDYSLSKSTFESKLPANYKYSLYNGELDNLKSYLSDKAGAGADTVNMTAVQWTKTSYGNGSSGEDPGPVTPPDTPNPPVNPEPTEGKAFRASSLDVGTLTADKEVNEFYTITKGCEIAEGKETINDIYFTKYIKLAGKGSKENSIKVTSPGKGTLTVYVASNNVSAARAAAGTLNLLDSTGSTVKDSATDITEAAAVTLQIPEKGEYYVASEEGELYVYGMDLAAEEESGDDNVIEFSLRADEIDLAELTSDYTKNSFTIKVKTGTKIAVSESSKGDYTKCIKLGGEGKVDNRSIHFTAEDTGTLTVYAVGSNKTDPKKLILHKLNGSQDTEYLSKDVEIGTALRELKYDIDEVGDYYVGGDGGINIYCIAFSNKKAEPTPPEEYAPVEVDAEWTTLPALTAESVYSADDAKDSSKVQYNLEGYAGAANVTGGGLIKEGTTGYYTVTNEEEFLKALKAVQNVTDKPNVIEITTDLNLGKLELKEKFNIDVFAKGEGSNEYSGVIKAYTIQPRMHPTLKKTGVSYLNMHGFQNLTIFSKNGATIKHAGMKFEDQSTKNIIIRNLAFDELWEWDEGGLDAKGKEQKPGDYDINDWDYMVIDEHAEGIWIDHCTFYKAYDGLIDIKNNSSDDKYFQRVTISWCEFLPGSKDNVFFNEQMKWLEDNINNEEVDIAYYRQLRKEHMKKPNEEDITNNPTMSAQDVWWYVYGQKKAHLLGSADTASEDKVLRVTFANNYHKNAMSRLPRLRFGKVHEYNCVFDAQQMDVQYQSGNPHITGNGAISACNGEMLLENCYIRGLRAPLRSGYSKETDDRGYINIINSVYYYMTKDENNEKKMMLTTPEITESSAGKKITDETKFKEKLPEGYVFTTYDATQLYNTVVPYVGAGKLDMTTVQWEATNYGTNDKGSQTPASPSQIEPEGPKDIEPTFPSWGDTEEPDDPNKPTDPTDPTIATPTATPGNGAQFPSGGGKITLDCGTDGAAIYYTMSATESGLTDPADETNANRVDYTKGTEISITEETYIWVVAIKDGVASEPLKCHYTVLAEGAVVKPIATPGSETQATPVKAGDKITLTTTAEVDNIYYTTGSTPETTANPTEESDKRQTYNPETGIVITEAVTIKAVAKKGDTYSDVATFTYTIKTDDTENDQKVKAPKATPAPEDGPVAKGTAIKFVSETSGAAIYYTTGSTPDATSDPREESSGRKLYDGTTGIVITEAMTIKAVAEKDNKYSDVVTLTYTISSGGSTVDPDDPKDPDDPGDDREHIWITGLAESYVYTGAKIMPDIKVWDCDIKGNDRLLSPNVDYKVSYKNNVKPGPNAEIIITGKGNYVGKDVTAKFRIEQAKLPANPVSVKGAKIEKIASRAYTGEVQYPDVKITFKDTKTATYTYTAETGYTKTNGDMDVSIAVSNNVNKGTATILVSGAEEKGKATSVKASFKITAVDLSKATVVATDGVYSPNGAAPGTLTVTLNGKTLVNGIDYTAKYSGNKKAGVPGTVTVAGKGNYANKAAKTYNIKKLSMSDIEVSAVTACENMEAGKVKATVVDKNGNVLKPAQYTLKIYKDAEGSAAYGAKDKLAASATTPSIYVEATAKDTANLETGSTAKAGFTVGKDISKAKFVLKQKKGIEYTGDEIELEDGDLTVTLKDAGTLHMGEDKDYVIVSYSNNINKGTATAVVKGVGKYSGTKTIKFKIAQRTMKKGTIKTPN